MSKHILLISYIFPPYPGIGGRRWAYHAAELASRGYTVHVITSQNPFTHQSLYTAIIKKYPQQIIIHQLPTLFPKTLIDFSDQSFIAKVRYKIALQFVKLFTKGSLYDRSFFWKKTLLKEASTLIEKYVIENVIVSGAPFSAVYYTTLLKKNNPNLNIIADFRDPWTWAENWGYHNLTPKRKLHEAFMEAEVMKNANYILAPVDKMINHLKSNYAFAINKIKLLPHFYVENEIPVLPKKKQTIKMLCYGTIHDGVGDYLSLLNKAIQDTSISIDFFTENINAQAHFEGNKNVRFYKPIPLKELFASINEYQFVLLINPDRVIDYVSTKFYEIIYSRTPIFYLANKGIASEFIVQNRLGIHADSATLLQQIEGLKNYNLEKEYNTTFDVSSFSLERVTDLVESFLI